MSKSYSKIKRIGICTGDNSEFYRERRRSIRTKERQTLKDTLAHTDISDFDDVYTPLNIPLKDDWSEPTDGTITMTGKSIQNDKLGWRDYRGTYITKNGKIKR